MEPVLVVAIQNTLNQFTGLLSRFKDLGVTDQVDTGRSNYLHSGLTGAAARGANTIRGDELNAVFDGTRRKV